jgi:transcriptional regulator with XRE-family HTH domain
MAKSGRPPKPAGPSKGCKALVKWINKKGLTRDQVCDLFDWEKSRLSRYTTGARMPNSRTMHRMEAMCGIPMSHWLES